MSRIFPDLTVIESKGLFRHSMFIQIRFQVIKFLFSFLTDYRLLKFQKLHV